MPMENQKNVVQKQTECGRWVQRLEVWYLIRWVRQYNTSFIEKIYKFLGDNEFSITSKSFMEANSLNNDFVKKMIDHRDGVFSRRENRTPVRVYFIPVKNKHFYCYTWFA